MIVADKLFLGSTAVDRAFIGGVEVWSAEAPGEAAAPFDANRLGVTVARRRPYSSPQVSRAGMLVARKP